MGVMRVTSAARIRALAISRVMTKFDDRLKIHSIRKAVRLTSAESGKLYCDFPRDVLSPVFQSSSFSV